MTSNIQMDQGIATDAVTNDKTNHFGQNLGQNESHTLRDCVQRAMQNYFDQVDGECVKDIYDMVLSEVEAPLLETVMLYVRDNQTKASEVLGLNRGTLRKKLKQYGML